MFNYKYLDLVKRLDKNLSTQLTSVKEVLLIKSKIEC